MLVYPQYRLNRMLIMLITINICACTYNGEQPYIPDEMVMISQSADSIPKLHQPSSYPDRLEEGVARIELLDEKGVDLSLIHI